MLSIKERGILQNIIRHCEKIIEKMKNLSRDQFSKDEDITEVICFNILQIGELAKKFEPSFIAKYNSVPWKHIKGMRDRVAHGYGTIDLNRIWQTASEDIKPLREYC